MITITKDETRSENLIDYYTVAIDKHFDRNYFEIDKGKIVDCTIDDRIIIVVYKIADLDFDSSDLTTAKSF